GRAFLYSAGVMQDLGTLGGRSYVYAINDAGQVVGRADVGDPAVSAESHAFLLTPKDADGDGKPDTWFEPDPSNSRRNLLMKDLGTFGGHISNALAVSPNGQAVGLADGTSQSYAFLYDGAKMVNLGLLPGGISSAAYS